MVRPVSMPAERLARVLNRNRNVTVLERSAILTAANYSINADTNFTTKFMTLVDVCTKARTQRR